MRLLLDTNIVIPLLSRQSQRLPTQILAATTDPQHQHYASAASIWEMAIKMRIGKLDMDCAPDDLPRLSNDLGLIDLPVSFAHAVTAVWPAPTTRDPFDRLLLAQCAVEGMRLVTLDRALAEHPYAWR